MTIKRERERDTHTHAHLYKHTVETLLKDTLLIRTVSEVPIVYFFVNKSTSKIRKPL